MKTTLKGKNLLQTRQEVNYLHFEVISLGGVSIPLISLHAEGY